MHSAESASHHFGVLSDPTGTLRTPTIVAQRESLFVRGNLTGNTVSG